MRHRFLTCGINTRIWGKLSYFFQISVGCKISSPFPDDNESDLWQTENDGPAAKRSKTDTNQAAEGTVQCPECQETFMTLVKLHTHAVNTHYYSQLKSLLQPQFKVRLFLQFPLL